MAESLDRAIRVGEGERASSHNAHAGDRVPVVYLERVDFGHTGMRSWTNHTPMNSILTV